MVESDSEPIHVIDGDPVFSVTAGTTYEEWVVFIRKIQWAVTFGGGMSGVRASAREWIREHPDEYAVLITPAPKKPADHVDVPSHLDFQKAAMRGDSERAREILDRIFEIEDRYTHKHK